MPAYKGEPEYYVNGEHEAIIDEETFYKVQETLDGKRKKTPKLSKAINPDLYLRKFLICPVCGCALTGATSSGNGGKYTYYFVVTIKTYKNESRERKRRVRSIHSPIKAQ